RSKLVRPRVKAPTDFGYQVFRNGGVGFDFAECVANEVGFGLGVRRETFGLSQRIIWTEDLTNAAWTKTGCMATNGQSDPFGGNKATVITRNGTASSENVNQSISTTNLGSRLVIAFDGKAGTLDSVTVSIYDSTAGVTVENVMVPLGLTWKRHV